MGGAGAGSGGARFMCMKPPLTPLNRTYKRTNGPLVRHTASQQWNSDRDGHTVSGRFRFFYVPPVFDLYSISASSLSRLRSDFFPTPFRPCFISIMMLFLTMFHRCSFSASSLFRLCSVYVPSLFRLCSVSIPTPFRPCFVSITSLF